MPTGSCFVGQSVDQIPNIESAFLPAIEHKCRLTKASLDHSTSFAYYIGQMAKLADISDSSATAVVGDRILSVAARLFRQQGYSATTVRDIARAANILPGSLHYRYGSKEGLLVALMERAINRLMGTVEEAIAGGHDPLDRLRLAVRAHLRLLLAGDDAVYVLLYDWRSLSAPAAEEMAAHRERYERFLDELIAGAAAFTPVRPGVDLKLLRLFGFGAVNWAAQWHRADDAYTAEEIADACFAYLAHGALMPPPDHATTGEANGGS
jgi:AcrR family transcriptional regulator